MNPDWHDVVLTVVLLFPVWGYLLVWAYEFIESLVKHTPMRSTREVFDYVRGDPGEMERRWQETERAQASPFAAEIEAKEPT